MGNGNGLVAEVDCENEADANLSLQIFDQGRMRFGALQRPDPTGETLEVPA